jgi:hypothetical protein
MRPPGLAAPSGLLRLPEDRLAALHLREDELGAGTAGTIEHEIDRRSPPPAEEDAVCSMISASSSHASSNWWQ